MLRVTDLDASIKYYTEALGCKLLRKKDNPEYKYTLAFLGYGPEDESTVFELTYNWCARRQALQTCRACRPDRMHDKSDLPLNLSHYSTMHMSFPNAVTLSSGHMMTARGERWNPATTSQRN